MSDETAPVPTPEQLVEVHQLAEKLRDLARTATSPATALNALLTAYLNTASDADALDLVPGAGQALGNAARAMQAHQSGEIQTAASNVH